MAEVKTKPAGMPSGNDLDGIEVPLDNPPAYLNLGKTNCAIENPPRQGEVRTYKVMVYCKEEHGPLERGDGEMRYERTMKVRLCWLDGAPKPPDPDDDQPGLFDEGGNTAEPEGEGDGDE